MNGEETADGQDELRFVQAGECGPGKVAIQPTAILTRGVVSTVGERPDGTTREIPKGFFQHR